MFVARYENTMRNARPKTGVQEAEWKSIEQIRLEKRRMALEAWRKQNAEEIEAERRRILREREAFDALMAKERERQLALAEEQARMRKAEDIETIRRARNTVPIARIIRLASRVFRLSPSELMGISRQRDHSFARQFVMYWARRRSRLTLPQLGRLLGGRDHTTCLHGVRAYTKKRAAMGRNLRPLG
jgi:chromosomal replication initiation ATPase DnaA